MNCQNITKNRELLPCPFCGGEAELIESDYGMYQTGYAVYCNGECRVKMGVTGRLSESYEWVPVFDTEAEAIAAWNTRAAMEFDNWFYLPKPREPIVEVTETTHAWDGTKVHTDVYYQIQEQAIVAWARELDEHITKRICEIWNPERTCHNLVDETDWFECSACETESSIEWCGSGYGTPNYCPNCGAKVIA